MSAVTERIAGRIPVPPAVEPTASAEVHPPTGRRDRRALVAVGSLVLICASIATFVGLYASAGDRTAAVVVEHALVQGQPITSADLGQAEVSVPEDVHYIAVADASTIEGKHAAAAIPAGSLLTPADLTVAPGVLPGDAVVGLALKDGQFPASGLVPGQQVMVVQTGTPGSPLTATTTGTDPTPTTSIGSSSSGSSAFTGPGTGILVSAATVVSVAQPGAATGGSYALLASVQVQTAVAPDVATASSADQVSLVLLPSGQAQGRAQGQGQGQSQGGSGTP